MSVDEKVEIYPFTIANPEIHAITSTGRSEFKCNRIPIIIYSIKIPMFQLFFLHINKTAISSDYAAEYMFLAVCGGSKMQTVLIMPNKILPLLKNLT